MAKLPDIKKYGFYFDQTKCGACNACTIACKDWNQINPGPVRHRVQFTFEHDFGSGKGFFPLSYSCNHCDEPACVAACAASAIAKDADTGVVTIDRSKCMGYQSCITACPWAKPMVADDKQEPAPSTKWLISHPARKCTTCVGDRLDKVSDKPACVLSCMGRCLDFGTVEYIKSTYGSDPDFVRLNPTDFPYAYSSNSTTTTDTGPNLYIKKMKPTGGQNGMRIHKSTVYTGKHK